MKRVVWSSDFHLGLTTDEIDRTDEIIRVLEHIFKHAVKVKADCVVIGGDIFDHNQPGEHLIGLFIAVLNILSEAGIVAYIMVGNHDAIAKHKRRSCLSFIRKLSAHGYKNLKLIDDVKTIKMGKIHFSFLPFVSNAHIDKKYGSAQQYMDAKMRTARKKLKPSDLWFVFSHLNVKDCVYGTEEFMLKKVETWVPEFLTEPDEQYPTPVIIQAHIHTRQEKKNIHIVGSPCFTAFGEKEDNKYFLQLDIPESARDGKGGLTYHETPCLKFKEFDFHITDPNQNVLTSEAHGFYGGVNLAEVDKNTIVKINLMMEESALGYDVEGLRKTFSDLAHYVKPIHPRIVRQRVKRNKGQTIQLAPKEAVKLWLKTHKPKNPKSIYKLASSYLEGVL